MAKRESITYEDLNQVMDAFKNNEGTDHKEEIKKRRINFIVGLLTLLHLR